MKLIEKKCPNCGANLEFKDSDKSCKCSHCGSSFEIERDKSVDDLFDQFDLKPVEKAVSVFSVVIFFIMFIFVAGFIAFVSYQVFSSSGGSFLGINKYISSISSLSNSDIRDIEHTSQMRIDDTAEGENNVYHSYMLSGKPKREKLYVAYKQDGNYIIAIYKANYHDFFHQENNYTVYVPVVFENVKGDITFNLGDGEVRAPEYYFNSEKTSYTYGYASFDEAYNNVVKPLEGEYKITEK